MTAARIFCHQSGRHRPPRTRDESTLMARLVRRPSRLRRLLSLAGACLLAVASVTAQNPTFTEYQVKAQYLSNFGRFVKKWSNRPMPSGDEPFDLCVLGQDPFGASLDAAVKGEDINGAPLNPRRVARAQDALGCRVLFISSAEGGQLAAILATLGGSPVLTVADIPDFVRQGGMIQFVMDGNKVKFEINLAASQRSGLSLSSDLLKVARGVRRVP